jgi:hypothetical protein
MKVWGKRMVIQGILEESRQHYQTQHDQVVARLLHIPKGYLRKQEKKGRTYWYLRRHITKKGYVDVYIGSAGEKACEGFITFVGERKQRINELKAIREALKQLGEKKVEMKERDYPAIFISLAETFGDAGLWEEGLTLIGSWCFNVYVQTFAVDFFPLRTMDFDFGLKIPYGGDKKDIDKLLRDLGFMPRVDIGYDKIDYVLPGVGMVEVFIDKEKASDEQRKKLKQDLSIRPASLSHLHLLVDNPVTVKVHGVHKSITVPSMPAFFVHRLITAKFGEYRDVVLDINKIRKDYKQAALVAKKILSDKGLREDLARIIEGLSPEFRIKMEESAQAVKEYVRLPDLSDEDVIYIQKMV